MKLFALSSALVSTLLLVAACAPPSFTPTATVKVAQSAPGSGAPSCGSWEGWTCQVNPGSPDQCFATCGAEKIACNGAQCSKSSSAAGASVCSDVHPTKAANCGDCRVAFDAGCR